MDAQFRLKINNEKYGVWICDESIEVKTGFNSIEPHMIYTFENIKQLNQFIKQLESLKEEAILKEIERVSSCINTIKMN